jgi:folate-dependent phosphoribosylglycinamide formyltransferase PurN
MLDLGWFSTGRDEAARLLLETVYRHIQNGSIVAKISFVFSNREPGESEQSDLFFQLVNSYGIPLICLSSQKFRARWNSNSMNRDKDSSAWRLEYDREVMAHLHTFQPDLCILAGYMLIVGEEMCHKYNMINLHPAAPGGPKGTWQEVIWTLIENRAKETGVMMHLVTPELDSGPVVTYCTFPIVGAPFDGLWQELTKRPLSEIKRKEGENNRLFRSIREQGVARELPLIVATLKAFSQGKIRIAAGKVLGENGKPIPGYDLSDEINKAIKLK